MWLINFRWSIGYNAFSTNQKWWWALWMWALEVSMVNAHMVLRRYCELKGVPMPYTHHDFNKKIGYTILITDK